MKNETKRKLTAETIAALAAVFIGTMMGEGDIIRNLISGIVAAVVAVIVIELYFRKKNKQ